MTTVIRMRMPEVQRLMTSEQGAVMRYLSYKATRVQQRAKIQAGKASHKLANSIVKRFVRIGDRASIWVGSERDGPNDLVPWIHHEGSKAHVIRPRNPGGVLVFEVGGVTVFARQVNHPGTKPNRYLTDSARAEGLRVRASRSALGTGVGV